jgi:WD40 repeat protein
MEELRIEGYTIERRRHDDGGAAHYEAVRLADGRPVSIRTVNLAAALEPRRRRRLERDLDIASSIRHRNICEFIAAGTLATGESYFVSERPGASTLDEYWLRRRLSGGTPAIKEVVAHFIQVCDGLSFLHQKGVIHRALHSAAITVGADGTPKIAHAGFAGAIYHDAIDAQAVVRVADPRTRAFEWLAPEQCDCDVDDGDVRADVFALGLLFFELLTGGVPRSLEGPLLQVRAQLKDAAVPKPSAWQREQSRHGHPRALQEAIDTNIDFITMRMVAKDPRERYASVAEVVDDLQRWLRGGQVAVLYKNPWKATLAAARKRPVVAMAIAGFVIYLGIVVRGTTVEASEAKRALYSSVIDEGRAAAAAQHVVQAEDVLWRAHATPLDRRAEFGTFAGGMLSGPARTHFALLELYANNPCLLTIGDARPSSAIVAIHKGRDLAFVDATGALRLFRAEDGRPIRADSSHRYQCCAWDEESGAFAAGCHDGTLCLIDASTGEILRNVRAHDSPVQQVAFLRRGAFVVTLGSDRSVRLLRTGDLIQTSELAAPSSAHLSMAVDAKRDRVYVGGSRRGLREFSIGAKGEVASSRELLDAAVGGSVIAMECGGDGHLLLHFTSPTGSLAWMDPFDTRMPWTRPLELGQPFAVSKDTGVVLWAEFSPVRFHAAHPAQASQNEITFSGERGQIAALTIASSDRFVSGDTSGAVKVFESRRRGDLSPFDIAKTRLLRSIHCIDLDPHSPRLAAANFNDGWILLFDTTTGKQTGEFEAHKGCAESLAFHPRDESTLFTAGRTDGALARWTLAERGATLVRKVTIPGESFSQINPSPDGRFIAVTSNSTNQVYIFDPELAEPPRVTSPHARRVSSVAWKPDSSAIATSGADGVIVVQSLAAGSEVVKLTGHRSTVHCLDWSRDGRWIASGAGHTEPSIRLWNVESKECVAVYPSPAGRIYSLQFSPDSMYIVAGDSGGGVQFLSVADGVQLMRLHNHAGAVFSVQFSGDGKLVYSSGQDGQILQCNPVYYNKHIAGNVAYQQSLLGQGRQDALYLQRQRAWAHATLGAK